jgi:alcohol dehydrogenase (NADP+)
MHRVKLAVKEAIKAGYRHIDCAAIYGNEREIGEALQECFQEGLVERQNLFVTSKLWLDMKADVLEGLKQTLSDLQLDYVDMYLIHWPVTLKKGGDGSGNRVILPYDEIAESETWKQMERAVELGLAKGIGLSNYSAKKINGLLKTAKIVPAINQVERHPYLQLPELMRFCDEKGIHVTGYSPLGASGRPDFARNADDPVLLEDKTLVEIAKKHQATPAQVVLAWGIQSGAPVIPKSTNPKRIQENLEAVKLSLDDQDMEKIKQLDRHRRYMQGTVWFGEDSPYNYENLWDE